MFVCSARNAWLQRAARLCRESRLVPWYASMQGSAACAGAQRGASAGATQGTVSAPIHVPPTACTKPSALQVHVHMFTLYIHSVYS